MQSKLINSEKNKQIHHYSSNNNACDAESPSSSLPLREYSASDFNFLKVLGQGAFGVVFLAFDKIANKDVAIKVMKHLQSRENQSAPGTHRFQQLQQEQLARESAILRQLNHPFIVKIQGQFHDPCNNSYLVMDLLKGGELFYHLRSSKTFSEERVKFYAACVLLALQHMQSKNIAYRDLKLENIMLDDVGYPILTDFGLAMQQTSTESQSQTATPNGPYLCGTPEYLSPEILLKIQQFQKQQVELQQGGLDLQQTYQQQSLGFSSDWWSYGVLLFEMLFGLPPFYNKDHRIMFSRILQEPVRFGSPFKAITCSTYAIDLIARVKTNN